MSASKESILKKITEKTLRCGVIGLGYVGFPLLVRMAQQGYTALGIDLDSQKVQKINNGEINSADMDHALFEKLLQAGRLSASTDISESKSLDLIVFCVQTPLNEDRTPDLRYITKAAEQVAGYLKAGTLVVLESTTYPGTTREVVAPILEHCAGLKCGEDFYLAFSPERIDPGNGQFTVANTPKVVGGLDADATELAVLFYEQITTGGVMAVSSAEAAEMEKLLENTYRNLNIALVNELAMVCHKMGIDVWEVIDAAKTKPYGYQAFYPGVGVGGHCIPLDPHYLTWKAQKEQIPAKLVELSCAVNEAMPAYIVQRCKEILIDLRGKKLLLLGVAYKADIDDVRESPACVLLELLEQQGADVGFYDPYISDFIYQGRTYTGIPAPTDQELSSYDLVVLVTPHRIFDCEHIAKHCTCLFDTKHAIKTDSSTKNIITL